MNLKTIVLAALAIALLSSTPALASPGMTTTAVNMRIGPGTQHAVITAIPPSQPVTIVGCLPGVTWCDVVWANYRGWVSGSYIHYYAAPSFPVPIATVHQRVPTISPWVDARRDARVEYRVHRRWDRWLGEQ